MEKKEMSFIEKFEAALKANQLCSQRYWRTLHVRIRASKCY